MCGIAGILKITDNGLPPTEADLHRMISRIQHRGPDGYGFFSDQNVGLAHARLSIIDLEGGAQPIHNEDKNIWVIFNGEIFNFIELRESLIASGHVFYTHSDTEVIVHLYEQYKEDFVQYLNGQFAIVLWDKANRKLLLARDRVGIAPLFYTVQNDRLIFASEVKAILPALNQSPRLDISSLDQAMTFWSPVSPRTLFEDIFEIPPGFIMTVENGKIVSTRYWDFTFPEQDIYCSESIEKQAETLRHLLIDATRIRLRSDVPVGAYLSGGLDSSVLVSLIHNFSDVPLRTFSIGFEDENLDEGEYQREMIRHLNADHSFLNCTYDNIAESFLDTIYHTEAPILRTAPVPMKLLSNLVHSNNYKVVLTGEGSDEVLGGYDIFKEAKIRNFWARNPSSQIRPLLLKKLYPYLELSQIRSRPYLEAFFGVGIEDADVPYFSHIPRWTTTGRCKEFFSDDTRSQLRTTALGAMVESLPARLKCFHPFNRSQYIEAKSLMGGYLLCSQGDRMLMANSVEGRFPFLDHRVIEFAATVHPKYKMKVLNEKYLLKKAMQDFLPPRIVQRYKQPYRAPDAPAFFQGQTAGITEELLNESTVRDFGYFDASKVSRLLHKIKKGRAIGYKDNMAFVGILSTQAWHKHFIKDFTRNFSSNEVKNVH